MSEPIHPPYNIVTPRQLDRWLDINAQNGALTRTRGFVSVPLSSISNLTGTTKGITVVNHAGADRIFQLLDSIGTVLETSGIVANNAQYVFNTILLNDAVSIENLSGTPFTIPKLGWIGTVTVEIGDTYTEVEKCSFAQRLRQFNYVAASNKFAILQDANYEALVAAFEGKFSLFVANVIAGDSHNSVVRYRLTENENDYVQATPYRGQTILKGYFQLEVWNRFDVIGSVGVLADTILNTSVLGSLDYRYGDDFAICAAPALVTNFNNTEVSATDSFGLPISFNANNVNGVN